MIKIVPSKNRYCNSCIHGDKDVKEIKYGSEDGILSCFNLCADCRKMLFELLKGEINEVEGINDRIGSGFSSC